MTRRFVRSPAAPKITIAQGGATMPLAVCGVAFDRVLPSGLSSIDVLFLVRCYASAIRATLQCRVSCGRSAALSSGTLRGRLFDVAAELVTHGGKQFVGEVRLSA